MVMAQAMCESGQHSDSVEALWGVRFWQPFAERQQTATGNRIHRSRTEEGGSYKRNYGFVSPDASAMQVTFEPPQGVSATSRAGLVLVNSQQQ